MKQLKPIRVLAIDPGTIKLGWAVLEKNGQVIRAIQYGYIKEQTNRKDPNDYIRRTKSLKGRVLELANEYKPDICVIEDVTKLHHGSKQAAICAGAITYAMNEVLNIEAAINPKTLKLFVTGYGNADKQLMQATVTKLIKGIDFYPSEDAADALAIGYTYLMGGCDND